MATFTDEHNKILDTTPHPTLSFPSEPKAPSSDPKPSKTYLLSYLRNRTPPLLRPCRYAYTIHDYILLPHLSKLYPTLKPQEKLSFHLLYPASATAHLVTSAVNTSLTRVLIAARRKACGQIADTTSAQRGERRSEAIIRFLMICHTMAGIDRELVSSALGEGGIKAVLEAGEEVAGDELLDNGLTESEMMRGMGGVLHQILVGAEVVDRGGYVRIDRSTNIEQGVGKKIGKRAGKGVDEIGEGVDVDATLRRLAVSEAQESALEEKVSGVWDLLEGTEGGIYDDEIDDAVLEGETGLSGLSELGEEEVEEEPVERNVRAGHSLNAGVNVNSGRGRGHGRGPGRGRGRGRGRGGRGRGSRKNASVRKQSSGMGTR